MEHINYDILAQKIADRLRPPEYVTLTELGDLVKCSQPTARKYVKEFEAAGGRGVLRERTYVRVPYREFFEWIKGKA